MGEGRNTLDTNQGSGSGEPKGHKQYVNGLNNMRQLITDIECDLDKLKRSYFCCEKNREQKYEDYVSLCNKRFHECNSVLRKNQVATAALDGGEGLGDMVQKLKEVDEAKESVEFVTDYQNHLRKALDSVQDIKVRYVEKCLRRLRSSCLSYRENSGVTNQLAKTYEEEVTRYQEQIIDTLKKFDQLTKSYNKVIKHDLFTSTHFTNKILGACDLKAFPILRLIPDLMDKVVSMCSKSRQWIDKDETYVHNISDIIREKRKQTRKKERDLRNQRERQNRLLKSVDETYNLFQDNKAKLAKIELELESLTQAVNAHNENRAVKLQEVKEKEGMVDFLDIGISQTKKNYSLQLKRTRILRQIRELEGNLRMIENELSELEAQIKVKAGEKLELTEKIRESSITHRILQTDLENFNKVVDKLQKEVSELTGSLGLLESLQSFKTSPEKVDDLLGIQGTVKLAPSLKEKITLRRKALTART